MNYDGQDSRKRDSLIDQYVQKAVTLETYARELSILGLAGWSFTGEIYAETLAEYLGLEIEVVRTPHAEGGLRTLGTTRYDVEAGSVSVAVPLRLRWWIYQYVLYHELGHVAAGHPLPVRTEDGTVTGFKAPGRWIARSSPVTGPAAEGLSHETRLALYEAEAELRARRGMLAGSLGRTLLQTGNLTQVR